MTLEALHPTTYPYPEHAGLEHQQFSEAEAAADAHAYQPRHALAEGMRDIAPVNDRGRALNPDGTLMSDTQVVELHQNRNLVRSSRGQHNAAHSHVETGSRRVDIDNEIGGFALRVERRSRSKEARGARAGQAAGEAIEAEKPGRTVVDVADQIVRERMREVDIRGKMPRIREGETDPAQRGRVREFFARRKEQLRDFGKAANGVFQSIWATEMAGVPISAQQRLLRRVDPAQLKHNFKYNSAALLGIPYRYDQYNHVVDNGVLRRAFYKQATAGNQTAFEYLRRHDPKFGVREMTLFEASKEAATILSGVAAARKIGRCAMVAYIAATYTNNPVRFERRKHRLQQIMEAEKSPIGRVKFEKDKEAYAKLAAQDHDFRNTPPPIPGI